MADDINEKFSLKNLDNIEENHQDEIPTSEPVIKQEPKDHKFSLNAPDEAATSIEPVRPNHPPRANTPQTSDEPPESSAGSFAEHDAATQVLSEEDSKKHILSLQEEKDEPNLTPPSLELSDQPPESSAGSFAEHDAATQVLGEEDSKKHIQSLQEEKEEPNLTPPSLALKLEDPSNTPEKIDYEAAFTDDGQGIITDESLDIPSQDFQSEFPDQSFGFAEPEDQKKDNEDKDEDEDIESIASLHRQGKHGKIQTPSQSHTQTSQYTNMELAQADPYIKRQRFLLYVMALLSLIGAGYYISNQPQLRAKAKAYADQVMAGDFDFSNTSEPNVVDVANKKSKSILNSALEEKLAKQSCQQLITEKGTVLRSKVSLAGSVRIAGCLIAAEEYQVARSIMNPIYNIIKKSPEEKINSHDALPEAYLLHAHLLMKEGFHEEAISFVNRLCSQWTFSATCVTKLYINSIYNPSNTLKNSFFSLQQQRDSKNHFLSAALFFAGGELLQRLNSYVNSDKLFNNVLALTANSHDWLYKDALEQWSLHLLKREDSDQLKRITGRHHSKLALISTRANWKVLLLNDLVSRRGEESLANFLRKSEYTFKAKKDYAFVIAIGTKAVIMNQHEAYDQLLGSTIRHFQGSLNQPKTVLKDLNEWRARSLMASERYREAFAILKKTTQLYGDTYILSHLQGICYLKINQHQKSQLLGSQKFKQSIEEKASWQNYFGLGLALINASKYNTAKKVLDSTAVHFKTQDAKKWFNLLEVEYLNGIKKHQAAMVKLEQLLSVHPTSIYGWHLKSQVYQKLIKQDEASLARNKASDLLKDISSIKAEQLSSPIGPLVFSSH